MPRHFTNWLQSYIDYTKTSESPTTFHFWTGVVTIASVLRRRVWQEQHIFQWIPNFYVIFVAPAGIATKSTTINFGMSLLDGIPGVRFGPESGSWQGLGDAFAAATEFFKWKDPYFGIEESIPMSAITIAASELGTFLRPDDESSLSFLTDVWDGRKRPFHHKTKHSGSIEILRPCLNFVGATTPSWIQRNIKENMIRDGLLSRIVFVYADQKRHFMSLPSRAIQGKDFIEFGKKLTDDLKEMSLLLGEFTFTPEVESPGGWMDTWYAAHQSARPSHLASDRFSGYVARKQTHLIKLAMILSVAKRPDLLITKNDLEEAEALLTDTEQSMLHVFESMGVIDEAKHIAEIVAFVRAYDFLTTSQLRRLTFNTMADRHFVPALRSAISGDLLQVEIRGGQKGVTATRKSNPQSTNGSGSPQAPAAH